MHPFTYERAKDEQAATTAGAATSASFLAGGTTLVDLMRLEVMRPETLVDLGGLVALSKIEQSADGSVKIGALVTNAALAYHAAILRGFPALSEAILAGASPQIRNVATTGGNLLQRTRCPYFRDPQVTSCNKRAPGSGCAAIGGVTRSHAVLGISEKCIATHPSDMAVAMVALDAVVHIRGAKGTRTIPIADLHELPGQHPEIETVLAPGELITHVELPATPFAKTSRYVKVRDRASYAFALASAAVAVQLEGGTIRAVRIALGGVGTKPWRAKDSEEMLVGKKGDRAAFSAAAAKALAGAKTQDGNRFKVELAQRTIVRALEEVTGGGA
jgi:xanthine dehydrogenase YagS FAD-binding subunit